MKIKIKTIGCLGGIALGVFFSIPIASGAGSVLLEVHSANADSSFWGRGDGFSVKKIAEWYKPAVAQTVCVVEHQVAKFSSPTDMLQLQIFVGGAAPELGSLMATASTPGSSLPASTATFTSFTINPCVALAANTDYWFVFSRTAPVSGNGYITAYRPSDEYANVSYWQFNEFSPQGWQQNLSREWSLRLRGPDLAAHEPVIIVPGILGTRLTRAVDGQEIWPSASELISSVSDAHLDELALSGGASASSSAAIKPGAVLDSILAKHAYDNLFDAFLDLSYASGTDLFMAPYDWRLDLSVSADHLKDVIKSALLKSPTGKVNVIAHSLGGLLVKEYLRQKGSAEEINKLILVGVPEVGAPKAFKALQYGDSFGFSVFGLGILNASRVKSIAQNMPAVYQLLPSRIYVERVGRYIVDFRDGPGRQLTYDESHEFMMSDQADRRNPSLLSLADFFHDRLDPIGFNMPADSVYRLVGCQNPATIGDIRVYPKNKFDIDAIDGDGTVPLLSSLHTPSGQVYASLYGETRINHLGLVSDVRAVSLLRDLVVSTSTPKLQPGFTRRLDDCKSGGLPGSYRKTLRVSTHSPVRLHVYDSKNRHTGPTASGDIELGIPESEYEMIGDNSFAFLPAGERYEAVMTATSAGSFDFRAVMFDGVATTTSVEYVDIPLASAATSARVSLSEPEKDLLLVLDPAGDGENLIKVRSAQAQAGLDAVRRDINEINEAQAFRSSGIKEKVLRELDLLSPEDFAVALRAHRSRCELSEAGYRILIHNVEARINH